MFSNLVNSTFLFCLYLICFISNHFSNCEQIYNKNNSEIFSRSLAVCLNNACSDWSEGTIKWTIINSDIGLVKFFLHPPPNCCESVISLTLYVLVDNECNDTDPSCTHSRKNISENECNLQNNEIECDVMFVFTSRYYFKINAADENNNTLEHFSNKFDVTTNYVKELFGNITPRIVPKYVPKRQELTFSISIGGDYGLPLVKKIEIEVLDGTEDGTEKEYYLKYTINHTHDGNKIGRCSCEESGDCSLNKTCHCHWEAQYVKCSFLGIPPGISDSVIYLEVYDPRCPDGVRNTLWVTSPEDCRWQIIYQLKSDELQFVTTATPPQDSNGVFILLGVIGILVALSLLAVTFCVFFKKYPKKIYSHYVSSHTPLQIEQLYSLTKPEVLLLYPRDCDSFMTVMANFRHILQESLHTQVYDMWDHENWDEVIEIGHQWAMKYITDENIKVIIVASSCSKVFEYALINRKNVEYRQGLNCLDNFFLYSFKESVAVTSFKEANYNRFFVVRLEETGCEENKFSSITPCTLYTLPQHLKDLALQIHNMNPSEVILNLEDPSKIDLLVHSLDELNRYKLNNPNYLKELLSMTDDHQLK